MKYILGGLIVLFASYADIFLFRVNIVPVPPSNFLIPLFMVLFIINYKITQLVDILKSHSFKFFLSIVIISAIYGWVGQSPLSIIIENIVLNIITLILYMFVLHYFKTEDKKTVMLVILSALVVLAGSVWYDLIFGLPKHNLTLAQAVRKGGFGENPNQAASGIKFLALGVLVFLENEKVKKYILLGLLFFSVFITFSRSGIVSVIMIIILGTLNNWQNSFQINLPKLFKNTFKLIFVLLIFYISLLSFADIIRENFPAFTRGTAGERLDLLLGQSEKKILDEDSKGGGRGDLLFKFVDDFMVNPFGYGTGYSSDKTFNRLNTHNYYLYMAVNYGIVALIIYLYYLHQTLKRSINRNQFYYLIFAILLIFEGFISHSIYHERAILVSLAFFDSLIYKKSQTENIF